MSKHSVGNGHCSRNTLRWSCILWFYFSDTFSGCLVSRISDDLEDKEKQVDDVEIEVERGKDIFLWVKGVSVATSHHQLSVEDDVTGKDERADGRVHDG